MPSTLSRPMERRSRWPSPTGGRGACPSCTCSPLVPRLSSTSSRLLSVSLATQVRLSIHRFHSNAYTVCEGYSKQFMTIPIYGVAFVFIVFFCFLSDIRKERGNYVTITSFIAGISFIICVSVSNEHVKYAFLCFAVGGVYACCPLTLLVSSSFLPFL